MRGLFRMTQIQNASTDSDEKHDHADNRRQGRQADHRQPKNDAGCRERREQEPDDVYRFDTCRRNLGQIAAGKPDAREPDRNVDEENPVPGGKGRNETTDRRADQRSDQTRNGQPGHGRDEIALRRGAHQHQSSHRRHHRAAHALDKAREHEFGQRAGHRAGDGTDDEDGDGDAENELCAVPVGDPGADRNKDGERNEVGRQRELERDRRRADVGCYHRKRGRDDRRIRVFHEKGDRENERDGSFHVDARGDVQDRQSSWPAGSTASLLCLAFIVQTTDLADAYYVAG
jgi:hypothetical protein